MVSLFGLRVFVCGFAVECCGVYLVFILFSYYSVVGYLLFRLLG